jgi:hypothetical protein
LWPFPGDLIHLNTSALIINGEAVKDVPLALLAGFSEVLEPTIPAGHYFVIGEKRVGPNSVVAYNAIIPTNNILGKITKP